MRNCSRFYCIKTKNLGTMRPAIAQHIGRDVVSSPFISYRGMRQRLFALLQPAKLVHVTFRACARRLVMGHKNVETFSAFAAVTWLYNQSTSDCND